MWRHGEGDLMSSLRAQQKVIQSTGSRKVWKHSISGQEVEQSPTKEEEESFSRSKSRRRKLDTKAKKKVELDEQWSGVA